MQTVRSAFVGASKKLLELAEQSWMAVVRSVWPSQDDAWLTDGQAKLFRRGTRNSAFLLSLGAFLLSQACAGWISWPTRTAWWIGVACVSVAAEFVGRYLDNRASASLQSIRERAAACLMTTIVFAIAWASMSIFLWVPGDEINHLTIVLILACSVAGSVAMCAVHPATGLAALSIYAAFMIFPLAGSKFELDHTLAWLAAVYVALMSGQLVTLTVQSTRMLMLEHERSDLVNGLQSAKQESDRDRTRAAVAGRTRSQFLSNMNHELRTPMNAILGFSELIRHKSFGNDADKYAEYAGIIHDSGEKLLALIDDMLDLAKIEGGRLSLRETSVDLKQIIVEAIESGERTADEGHLSVTKRIRRGFPMLHADERAIRQIVSNLFSNALKFTPPGGCITVFAEIDHDGRPAFGVEDTGVGIAEEDQATVFERFGKGRHDVTTMDKGTGLGLAIVKGFAEAHDGEVLLDSGLGEGTRVTVLLPVSRTEAQHSQKRMAG